MKCLTYGCKSTISGSEVRSSLTTAFPNTHIHSSFLDRSLTWLSNGTFLKLWLPKRVEVRLIRSGCVCLPSHCLPTACWIPCLSSSCTSGSRSPFARFALLMEPLSESRLTREISDGDVSVVESGLWMGMDEKEEQQGLKAEKETQCYWNALCLGDCARTNPHPFKHGGLERQTKSFQHSKEKQSQSELLPSICDFKTTHQGFSNSTQNGCKILYIRHYTHSLHVEHVNACLMTLSW